MIEATTDKKNNHILGKTALNISTEKSAPTTAFADNNKPAPEPTKGA